MVNDRLMMRTRLPSFRLALRRAWTAPYDHTQPLSSRMASCQIISMPASLSLRHGMTAKFCPPLRLNTRAFSTAISSSVSRQSAEKPGMIMTRFFTPFLASAFTVLIV